MGYDQPPGELSFFPVTTCATKPVQQTVETKKEKAADPRPTLKPQSRKKHRVFDLPATGKLAVEITHHDTVEIDDAVRMLRLFIRE